MGPIQALIVILPQILLALAAGLVALFKPKTYKLFAAYLRTRRDETATGHGTQKPVELMRRPILNHTERGDRVYDPFLGSGTTVIAAEQTERACYGLEIDPRYVDVIVRRWEEFSGNRATLAGADQAFEQVRAARQMRPK